MSYFDSSNATDVLLLPHGLRDHDDLAAVAAIVEADVIARYTYSVFSDDSQAILTQGGQILGTGVAFPAGAVSISESRVVCLRGYAENATAASAGLAPALNRTIADGIRWRMATWQKDVSVDSKSSGKGTSVSYNARAEGSFPMTIDKWLRVFDVRPPVY